MTTITDLKIVNRAYRKIGEAPIDSFTEETYTAELANDLYQSVKDEELSTNIWNFAKKTVTLSQYIITDMDEEFACAFKLPKDILKFVKLGNIMCFFDKMPDNFYINDKIIYSRSNLDTLKVTYITSECEEHNFTPLFSKALSFALAKEFIPSTNNNDAKMQLAVMDYNKAIAEAKRTSALDNPKRSKIMGDLVRRRRYLGG